MFRIRKFAGGFRLHAGDDRNLSELLQHEIDHLDGILAVDRIIDIRTLHARRVRTALSSSRAHMLSQRPSR